MMRDHAEEMVSRREALLNRLVELTKADSRIAALWLQGSLARGDHDPYSDIDAYLAIDDADFADIWNARAQMLAKIARPLAWSDATSPGLKAIHALLEGGVKLDLFFEPLSQLEQTRRPAVHVLYDAEGCAPRPLTGFEAPTEAIAYIVSIIIRMTRQGATWPLRLLHRSQWSTLAMMEVDLINAQIAQLMAVQRDPANFYMNPFTLYRLLDAAQQAEIDRLTERALAAVSRRDTAALKVVHLEVYDALVREGRAACSALGAPYPLGQAEEADLRALLEAEWPG
jgi:predicted nucleotidyltransferase